ncbi:MAG: MFS transporter [Proteobacteria bacterium]|nr:MFS transporter [Pseudomonadota bacterium]
MTKADGKDGKKPVFTKKEGFLVFLAYIGVQLCSEVLNQWGTYFYSPSDGGGRTIYISIGLVGIIFIAGTVWDAITDPFIGSYSDRTKLHRARKGFLRIEGKRRPFIFWGSILMMFPAIAFWYPPVMGESSANLFWGTVMLCLHWTMLTITAIPIAALTLDIAKREEDRVKIGTWIALGFIIGLAIANALTGVLIDIMDPAPEGMVTSPEGYRRVVIIYSILSLVFFQLLVWGVREREQEAASKDGAEQHESLLSGLASAMRNRAFIPYFFSFLLFTAGFLAAQRILPYWAETGLGGDESTVTLLLVPFIITALISYAFIPFFARILHVKWMIILAFAIICTGLPMIYVIGVIEAASSTKVMMGAGVFAYCGIGQGIMYVMMTPMLGEIIDYDQKQSGRRREALYNGLSGVAWKASMAISILVATQSMNIWGNSVDRFEGVLYVGPIAGGLALIGILVMLFYPSHVEMSRIKAELSQ